MSEDVPSALAWMETATVLMFAVLTAQGLLSVYHFYWEYHQEGHEVAGLEPSRSTGRKSVAFRPNSFDGAELVLIRAEEEEMQGTFNGTQNAPEFSEKRPISMAAAAELLEATWIMGVVDDVDDDEKGGDNKAADRKPLRNRPQLPKGKIAPPPFMPSPKVPHRPFSPTQQPRPSNDDKPLIDNEMFPVAKPAQQQQQQQQQQPQQQQ